MLIGKYQYKTKRRKKEPEKREEDKEQVHRGDLSGHGLGQPENTIVLIYRSEGE